MAWSRPSYPRLLLGALVITVGLTVFVTASTSTAAFGAYNPAWDGTTEVRDTATAAGAEPTIVQNTTQYQQVPPENSVAVVFSPTTEYSEGEAARLRSFVEAGGTVLIADDYRAHSNPLLASLGAEARIDPVPLRDEQLSGPSPAFPRTQRVSNNTIGGNATSLMLNHGGTVQPNGATVLFVSSEFSYRDQNQDETLNEDEQLTQHPVVTVESVGAGTIIVASDASLFLNAMLERADNAMFLQALVEPHEHVLIDVSHSAGVPPLVAVQLLLQQSGGLAFLAGIISIIGVVLLPHLPQVRRRIIAWRDTPESPIPRTPEDIAAGIRTQHPEWDADRVERVTDSLMSRRQQREDND
ncbi:DUF4350 domain-containing protein [Halobellus sp. GM3]|uniref:DUF4350 domain-containing protein n=1 Tax=Halobellus sp. GM3 TaxID=3458410 RepID=UPI00403E0A84